MRIRIRSTSKHGIHQHNSSEARTFERPRQLRDPDWLRARYQNANTTTIAEELDINPQMVYAALFDFSDLDQLTALITQSPTGGSPLDGRG